MRKKISVLSLGVDPGFAHSGYGIIYGERKIGEINWKAKLIDFGHLQTKKSNEKTRGQIRVSNDDQRRLDELILEINAVKDIFESNIRKRNPSVAVSGMEWFAPYQSGGRGWTTSLGLGAWYVIMKQGVNHFFIWLNTDVKKETCGEIKSSKIDIQNKISETFNIEFEGAKSTHEHQADAIAIAVMNLKEYDRLYNPDAMML